MVVLAVVVVMVVAMEVVKTAKLVGMVAAMVKMSRGGRGSGQDSGNDDALAAHGNRECWHSMSAESNGNTHMVAMVLETMK